ncbi:MAG: ArnT family glycosyltransferase [Thermoleophilaceae bacterium]
MRRLRSFVRPRHLLLLAILASGFFLRIWNNHYGLPFVWSLDEGNHFTSRAVGMFHSGLNPGYYQNPAAYTYLVYGLLRAIYGPLGLQLRFGNVTQQFSSDPTGIWGIARTLAAVLCTAGVAAVYLAARRLWGSREGLVAAAILAFAFLPVAYSRVAVTDVGALAGVALALWGAVRASEDGRLRWYLLAGAAGGLALAFKYTAGLVLLPLGIAAAARLRHDRLRAPLFLVAGGLAAAAVFVLLNPYVFTSFDAFWHDLHSQADVAANQPKAGQDRGGFLYYLDSLGWGLGWAGAAAALAGAVLELRRRPARGLILIALPLALFLYLSLQSRYFGRWLLPAYPVLAMLAAVALVRCAALLRRPVVAAAALVALSALVLAQPLAADIRSGLVLGRDDTREQVRGYLARRLPPELRASFEPAVPGRYFGVAPDGRDPPWLRRCPPPARSSERGWSYPGPAGSRVCGRFKPGQFSRPDGGVRASAYHQVLGPATIDDYRFYGYCVVVTFGLVRDRVLETGSGPVRGYYRRLKGESRVLARFSPYRAGAKPVSFSFDLSYNYYPTAYERPGPAATVYRLRRCRQAYGAPVIQVPRARELPPHPPPKSG